MKKLIADVGGTNTRCALIDESGELQAIRVEQNNDFADLRGVIEGYLREVDPSPRPEVGAIAIAAPIIGDEVRLTNRVWSFSIEGLKQQLGLSRLQVINDFTAQALSLPHLPPDQLVKVGPGTPEPHSTKAVIGPGTGLGVSGLVPTNGSWRAISGEGGHVTLPAADEREAEVISLMGERFGHCSAERIISGPGLSALYDVLLQEAGKSAENTTPKEVTELSERGDPIAAEAMRHFFNMLGTVAGNVALILGARGGVYIGGGIIPRHRGAFLASPFRERFEAKGRYQAYMADIPTYVIIAKTPALLGLKALLEEL